MLSSSNRTLFCLFLATGVLLSASLEAHAQACQKIQNAIRISNTGDILIHKALYQEVVSEGHSFNILWKNLIPVFKDADLMIGNLEGPVAPGTLAGGQNANDPGFVYDDHVYSGTNFVFNYHPQILDDLKSSGFDLLTVANNHAMDRGGLGMDRTLDEFEKRSLPSIGARRRSETGGRSRILEISGYKIGVIACAEMLNGMSDPKSQILLCDKEEVVREISSLKGRTDLVAVFPHWGEEYEGQPASRQKKKAREWVAAGARLIVGNHPHVLQTAEWLTGPADTKALVVYSLGNFVAGQAAMEKRATAITHVDLIPTSAGLEIAQFSYTPVLRPSGEFSLQAVSTERTSEVLSHIQHQLGPAHCL